MALVLMFLEALTDAVAAHAASIRMLNLRGQRQFLRMRSMERRIRVLEHLNRPM